LTRYLYLHAHLPPRQVRVYVRPQEGTVDAATLSKLQAADDPQHYDYPREFNHQESLNRVCAVKPLLEDIAGCLMSLDDQVQDASYFADLCLTEPREGNGIEHMRVTFCVRFSCFGSLVTIYNENVLPDEKVGQLRSVLEARGFAFADAAVLNEPYTGSHAGFQGCTWMDRFFSYT
jgi:hypothetical protein